MLRYNDSLQALAFGWALLAGFVDAIGFLMSGGLFVSFMSGNSTRLAIELGAASGLIARAALLIGLFVLGVVGGVVACARIEVVHRKVTATVMVTTLLLCAATLETLDESGATVWVLCAAMGAANVVFQREGDVSVGVTYMTGNLVRLGYRLAHALLGKDRAAWVPYLLLWIAFVTGGVAGALGYRVSTALCLWLATAFAALLAVAAHRLTQRAP